MMKRIRCWQAVAVLAVMAAAFMALQTGSVANAATREENVRKIENYLGSDTAKNSMQKRGLSSKRVLKSLTRFTDAQVENLAQRANIQVGGALDRDSSDDFWTVYKWYLIVVGAVFVISMIVLLATP